MASNEALAVDSGDDPQGGSDLIVNESDDSGGGAEGENDLEAAVPEKLADDVIKPPLWKRILYGVFPSLQKIEEKRVLRANDSVYNAQFKYAKNYVFTSKYNLITFLPKNLFEQFLRVANLYFLFLLIIQVIPGIASVPFYTTLIPLVIVLGVTMVKDAFDDIRRHINDYKVNHRIAHIQGPSGTLSDYIWQKVTVGDIIRLERDDFITADILLLSSSEPNSLIYIETAELDGETNLKVRQALPETAELMQDKAKLTAFNGEVTCEPPNNRLHKFVGTLTWNDKVYSLDNDKIILRGCRLRNTGWMYGLVIYAGHDTKLVQNSGRTKFKRTHLDHFMNKAVLFILLYLVMCVLICLIGSLIFESVYGTGFSVYAFYYDSLQDNPGELAFLQILSNVIVLNTFVPISLYVSVETIRLGLSLLINWDVKMYYAPEDVPAVSRTTTLNEELGQIEYIFSDKTGTLTQNVMTFLKGSIRGVKCGDTNADHHDTETIVTTGEVVPKPVESHTPLDFTSWNSYADKNFVYYDKDFLEKCRSGNEDCDEFFRLLSLCHTVLPSKKGETGELVYNAQSPDEAALVSAAKNFGYVFKARSPFTITVDKLNSGKEEVYEVLNILDFNNERKRMSIIVKYEDKITLYCKGADSVVFARLGKGQENLMKTTLHHLGDYAREGLRTLVLAKKDITPEEYAVWAEGYHEASILQKDREQAVEIMYNKIEQNLDLIGATAIEDKLQDGVPETIANLAKADIKIWVLTGDKQETAINIGFSSKLLTPDMKVFVVDENTEDGVLKQLREANESIINLEKEDNEEEYKVNLEADREHVEEDLHDGDDDVQHDPTGPPFGIVLNGHSLRYALKDNIKLELLETACKCKAVICCRVTPLQKKRVVDLVKKQKGAVTLAIGDGANDVGMIKAAHIGVGISGREGQQAVLSSDYSFGQFRFLERLLLVHGRWSYHRMTTFLRYFFYKNFAFTFSQFLFAFFCGFTAQTLYDSTYIAIYNLVYTSLPVLALAILDQDVDENNCYRYPNLYIAGQKNQNFNSIIFVRTLIKGIYVAIIFFFVLFGMLAFNVYPDGYEWDYQSFGLAASFALTIIVNLQIALDTFYWNPIMHLFVWSSILIWFVVIPSTSSATFYSDFFQYGGVAYEVLSTPNFWFYFPLATVVALLPTIIFRLYNIYFHPTFIDYVRLKEGKEGKKTFLRKRMRHRPTKPLKRTGYAFSHQEGFGELITTGHIFGMDAGNVTLERSRRHSIIISTPVLSRATTTEPSMISVPEEQEPESVPPVGEEPKHQSPTTVEETAHAKEEDKAVSGSFTDDEKIGLLSSAEIIVAEELSDIPSKDKDPVEQVNSAFAPSVTIPGRVDSPEGGGSDDGQAATGETSNEGITDDNEAVVEVSIV